MPIFEYKCTGCGVKYEILHKTKEKIEDIRCPECGSAEYKKLFSSFSASVHQSPSRSFGCGDSGTCEAGLSGGCPSAGMCGMH